MTSFHLTGEALWKRMERAVEKVETRLEKTATTLEDAAILYSIIGEQAVRTWVAQADEAAVRTTLDVDILLRRADWPAAIDAMQAVGCVYRHAKSIDMFLDGPDAKARDAVHVLFAGESMCRSREKKCAPMIRCQPRMSPKQKKYSGIARSSSTRWCE